jgi:hypothetical protein
VDTFGAVTLPVSTSTAGQPIADPGLFYLGQFIQAVLNASAANCWTPVNPPNSVVRFVKYHEPDEACFREAELPALFLWREKSEGKGADWIAEDILQVHDLIQCVWAMPHDAQAKLKVRYPAPNGIMKSLTAAIEHGVHSAWTVAGDTSPDPVTGGSVLARWGGFDGLYTGTWQRKVLNVQVGDGGERRLYGTIEWTIRTDEGLVQDISKYAACSGINQTIQTPAPNSLVTEYAEFR